MIEQGKTVFFCVFYTGLGAHPITITTLIFEIDFGFFDIIFIEVKYMLSTAIQ